MTWRQSGKGLLDGRDSLLKHLDSQSRERFCREEARVEIAMPKLPSAPSGCNRPEPPRKSSAK